MPAAVVSAALVVAGLAGGSSVAPGSAHAATPTASATTDLSARLPKPKPRPKVLLIGLDGAAFARLADARMPVLDRLRRQGLTAPSMLPYAPPVAPTVSGPGWSTILTGVGPGKHHVRDNYFRGRRFDRYPDVLTRVEHARPALATAGFSIWDPVTEIILGRAVDRRVDRRVDNEVTSAASRYLRSARADATFVHLCEVDHAGHAHGADSAEYAAALGRVDRRIGRLLRAVRSRASYDGEDWLVLVTADHGMRPRGGHGGGTPAERRTFVVAVGDGIRPGSRSRAVGVTDLAPTILDHLGIRVRRQWGLDGRALDDVLASTRP